MSRRRVGLRIPKSSPDTDTYWSYKNQDEVLFRVVGMVPDMHGTVLKDWYVVLQPYDLSQEHSREKYIAISGLDTAKYAGPRSSYDKNRYVQLDSFLENFSKPSELAMGLFEMREYG